MTYGNCFIYALRQRWRHGGYVITRRSKYGWWPHFIWSPDLREFRHFIPDRPAHERLIPPLLFRGSVRAVVPPE